VEWFRILQSATSIEWKVLLLQGEWLREMALTVLCVWTVPLLFVDVLYSDDPAKWETDLLIQSFILTSFSMKAK
jgi:hypothetical protein